MEVFDDNLKIEIISKLRYIDILEFDQINKKYHLLCNSNMLWNEMINRDFGFYNHDGNDARKIYEYWYKFFNKHTKTLMYAFVIYNLRYDKLVQAYEKIFALLIKYISLIDVKEKDFEKYDQHSLYCIENKMSAENLEDEYHLIQEIFRVSNIKIGEYKEFIKSPPSIMNDCIGTAYNDNKVSKRIRLRRLIYQMINDYKEPQ